MSRTPPVNPNVHNIADRAKHGYAIGTQLLAATQYRLAELAGTGHLDPDESMKLQHNLFHIWEALYASTVCAVRDETPMTAPGMRPTTHTWPPGHGPDPNRARGNLGDPLGVKPIHARRRRPQ
jgi:hypothetical protein